MKNEVVIEFVKELFILNEKAIFVDFDQTLACSSLYNFESLYKIDLRTGEKIFRFSKAAKVKLMYYKKYPIEVILRPGALDFLRKIRTFADKIFILTAGHTLPQKAIAHELEILNLVDELFGYDAYSKVPKYHKAVLVENEEDPLSQHNQDKLNAIGVDRCNTCNSINELKRHYGKYLINVPAYIKDDETNVFDSILQEIQQKLI